MKKNSGLTILEVLIASMIFAIVVSASVTTLVSIRSLSKEFEYRYTALNLAKEVLEFGESSVFGHPFKMKYYYPGATVCTLPSPGCDNIPSNPCRKGLETSVGYGIKEWYFFCISNPTPFTYLGDIKAKNLVPKGAPDSVVIYYGAEKYTAGDPTPFGKYYKKTFYLETTTVSWQEALGGPTKKETLSVLPIRQVNDVLHLGTAEFWWE
jgi:prepilin-type N-terminal cleavage/methylation domain-containing protein